MNDHCHQLICVTLNSSENLDDTVERLRAFEKCQNLGRKSQGNQQGFFGSEIDENRRIDESELSFQKELLKEHIQVINKELPAFELFLGQNKYIVNQLLSQKKERKHSKVYVSFDRNVQDKLMDVESLLPDLFMEFNNSLPPQLSSFMRKLMRPSQPDINMALSQITRIIIEKYLSHQNRMSEVYQLLNYSQQILDALLLECENILFYRALTAESRNYFANFLQIYCATILLVLNQYFQNPYFEKPSYNFPQSDDEEMEYSSKSSYKRLHRDSTDAL